MEAKFSFSKLGFAPYEHQVECSSHIDCFFNGYKKRGVVLCASTGSGKTEVALHATEVARQHGKKTIVLTPLKELTRQHGEERWAKWGYETLVLNSDYEENKKRVLSPSVEVIVSTFDMLYHIAISPRKIDSLMAEVGLIVVDEAHTIQDEGRGWKLESAINIIMDRYPTKFVFLTATMKNPREFADHYNCHLVENLKRPTPLNVYPTEFFKEVGKKGEAIQKNVDQIITKYIAQFGKDRFPNIIFFCTTKSDTWTLADYCQTTYGIPCGIHNASVDAEGRKSVCYQFKKGTTKVIFSTTTLSMGVDYPCDVVVVLDVVFWNWLKGKNDLVKSSQLIQMIGRAGRGNGTLPYGDAHIFYTGEYGDFVKFAVENPMVVKSRIVKRTLTEYEDEPKDNLPSALLGWAVAGYGSKAALQGMFQKCLF